MATKTVSVYEALIEVSRINDQIEKINYGSKLFIGYGPENAKIIGGINRVDFENGLKSNYDSIHHLIKNLAEYKAKIALSNATTKIKIGEKEYTIAEAIQRKANVSVELKLLQDIATQIANANKEINMSNIKVETGLPTYLAQVKTESSTPEDIEKLTSAYKLDRTYKIIDPYGLVDKVESMREELAQFVSEVDSKITTSNCTTIIDVELED